MIPNSGIRGDFQETLGAVVPGDYYPGPRGIWALEPLLERGQSLSLKSGTPHLSGKPGWGWLEQRRIQPKAGDEGDGMHQRLAEMQQFKHGVTAVGHQHQGPVGQPATQLEDNLPGPVGEFLGPSSLALVVALRGCQGGEHRQRPRPAGTRG